MDEFFEHFNLFSNSGVLGAYRSCIQRIQLYGPTNFAPTVNHIANIARNFIDGSQYFILLIVTDGIITDMPQTKSVRLYASERISTC